MACVCVVIVNYRTQDLVIDCLHSLADEVRREPDCRIVVVDNHSDDGSVDKIRAAIARNGWECRAEIVAQPANRGFAAGNKAALRSLLTAAKPPDYLLLLNPDTLVRPGAVAALVDFMEGHPSVGIAGSRLEGPDGTPQRSAFRFPSVPSELEGGVRLGVISRLLRHRIVAPPARDCSHRTNWVSGASMIVRRQVFESVGFIDESYFLYYEEVDFCRAARVAGWSCWYVPASRVVHLVGQSSGVTDTRRPARPVPTYWFASRRRYFIKSHGPVYALLADIAWVFGFTLWRLRRRLQQLPDCDPPGLLWDFVRFNFLSRRLLS
jgi:GT2 family glycosyltransferase